MSVTPTQSQVYEALVSFVKGLIPGVPVIRGLSNRTAMPSPSPGFIVLQALFEKRLRMQIDTWDTTGGTPTTGTIEQGIEVPVQIDCYGPTSGDWAATLSTAFQDDYGCQALAPYCQPLFATEARMMPLIDAEEQYEERWSVDCHLQYNPAVSIPRQFADALSVTLVDVPEKYPP